MDTTQNTRSIAAGSDPDVQALVAEWIADGFTVESARDGRGWWHRRISPEYIRDVNLPTNPINMFATVESAGQGASQRIGRHLADGHVIDSRPFGGRWLNRVGQNAGAQ